MQEQDCARYDEKFAAILASSKQAWSFVYRDLHSVPQKACEDLVWNRSKHMGSKRVKEETTTQSVRSGLDEQRWTEAMKSFCFFETLNVHSRRKNSSRKKIRHSISQTNNTLWNKDISSFIFQKKTATSIQLKSSQKYLHWICLERGERLDSFPSPRQKVQTKPCSHPLVSPRQHRIFQLWVSLHSRSTNPQWQSRSYSHPSLYEKERIWNSHGSHARNIEVRRRPNG